eukprot:sb/3479219/
MVYTFEEINLIWPRFSGHPDLVDKILSPEGVPKSGSDCIQWKKYSFSLQLQSDPDLGAPNLGTPRFRDKISFPRYRKLTLFDLDSGVPKSGSDCS